MRFQTFALENFFSPVVRPLLPNPLGVSYMLWISQSNGVSPIPPDFVAEALDFHFCAPPKHFSVKSLSPWIFNTSVASASVQASLIRIGVFAKDGIIFHLHHNLEVALASLPAPSPANLDAGPSPPKDSNFKTQSLFVMMMGRARSPITLVWMVKSLLTCWFLHLPRRRPCNLRGIWIGPQPTCSP